MMPPAPFVRRERPPVFRVVFMVFSFVSESTHERPRTWRELLRRAHSGVFRNYTLIYTLSPRKTAEYVRKTAVFREKRRDSTFRHHGTLLNHAVFLGLKTLLGNVELEFDDVAVLHDVAAFLTELAFSDLRHVEPSGGNEIVIGDEHALMKPFEVGVDHAGGSGGVALVDLPCALPSRLR